MDQRYKVVLDINEHEVDGDQAKEPRKWMYASVDVDNTRIQ
jgi:hypothetical protein